MHKLHSTVVAALLAAAVVLGGIAVLRTTGLGSSAQHANDAAVAAKTRQLATFERGLRRALAARTPALPKQPARSVTPAPPAQQRVIYHRPPPIVVVKHTHRGDDGHEAEGGGGGDD